MTTGNSPPRPASSSSSSTRLLLRRKTTRGGLLDLIRHDVEPDGQRIILNFLSTTDRLRLSECSKSLLQYRNHLFNIKVVRHPSATRGLEKALIRLLSQQVSLLCLRVVHALVLPSVLEAMRLGWLKGLKSLDLSQILVKDNDAAALETALVKGGCPQLEELHVRFFVDGVVTHVMSALSLGACPSIRQLKLHKQLTTYDASRSTPLPVRGDGRKYRQSFGAALKSGYCQRLQELDLIGIWLDDEGMRAFAQALQQGACVDLHALSLAGCAMGPAGVASLGEALGAGSCPRLELLNLSSTDFMGGTIISVANALAAGGCRALQHLEFQRAGMRVNEGRALARALASGKCTSLRRLNISLNKHVGDEAVSEIVRALGSGVCPHLEELRLDNTGMGREGAQALVKEMKEGAWPGLKVLNVKGARNMGQQEEALLHEEVMKRMVVVPW